MKDAQDARFDKYEEVKEKTEYVEKSIFDCLDKFLETKDTHELEKIKEIQEGTLYYMTSRIRRASIIMLILIEELETLSDSSFAKNISNGQMLMDKYIVTILMLRRIEQAPEEPIADEAYTYLESVSLYAIRNILREEYFEQRSSILERLYEKWASAMAIQNRIEWLMEIISKKQSDKWLLEMAGLSIELGSGKTALKYLKLIRKRSAEIEEIIESLECDR